MLFWRQVVFDSIGWMEGLEEFAGNSVVMVSFLPCRDMVLAHVTSFPAFVMMIRDPPGYKQAPLSMCSP